MSWNMRRSHCLTCGMSRKFCNLIFFMYHFSSRMSCKRRSPYYRHAELSGMYPFPKCVYSIPRTRIFRIFFLKVWQEMFRALCRPKTQSSVVVSIKENPKVLVFPQISLLEFFHNILILRRTGASSGMFHVPCDSLI